MRSARPGRKAGAIVLAIVLILVLGAAALRHAARSRTAQLFGSIVARVETADSVVALTFDDGPVAEVVADLLDTLRSRDVRATFFVTGAELARAPDAGAAIVRAGHELGNHTFSHRRLVFVRSATVVREIRDTDSLIRRAGQRDPILVRPPYGVKLVALPLHLARSNRITAMWDLEPDSYPEVAASPEGIVRHTLGRVRPGSIVLLHPWYSSRATSRAAIPILIDSLHARGYRITTMGALLSGR